MRARRGKIAGTGFEDPRLSTTRHPAARDGASEANRRLRVLYALEKYPQLSQSYIRAEIACARRAARMVIRRQRIATRLQLNVKRAEDVFNIALQIIEIELAFGFVNAFGTQCSHRRHL